MSFNHWLNYATIILIMGLAGLLVHFIAGARYSLTKALFRVVFCFDGWYIRWFYKNTIYLWASSLLIWLVCTELTLITQFSEGSIFQRPRFIFIVSPMLWVSIFGTLAWLIIYYNKTKKDA